MIEMESQSEIIGQRTMLPPSPGTFQDREDLIKYVRDFGASQGYVVTIKKSRRDRRVILGCDRGGIYRNRRKMEETKRKRKASSRLINCPFEAIGKKEDDEWILTIKNGEHNHEPLRDISEHPYSRRFTEEEVRQIKLMTEAGIKPRQVLQTLKQINPEFQSTPRHLYNLKAKIRQGNLTEKSFKSWRPSKSASINTAPEALSKHSFPLKVPNYIGGRLLDSQSCMVIDVVNPATQDVVSQVPLATYEELEAAVTAAKQAFPSWKNTPVATRQRIMFKLQELVHRDADKLAVNIATEQGKTLSDAKGDVLRGLEAVEHACSMATLQTGEFVPNASNGVDTFFIREPLGICAGICSGNFSSVVSLWIFPIAVVCGNTFVLKPSQSNPGASMMLAALAAEAGIPDGVLNIVHGNHEIANRMCDDDEIKALSFIGPNTDGINIYARAAARGKRVQYNRGAKNHAIIMPDASADATLDALMASGFGAAGQRCMTLSTAIFVGGSAPWEQEIIERAKGLKVNAGVEAGADVGPVISKEAKEQTHKLVQSSLQNGARLVLDGRNVMVPKYERGNFIGPTILCDVTTQMECYKEEMFGPVLLCMQTGSLEEALTIVNQNKYGNGASIFTTSGYSARRFQSEVEAALVGINVALPMPPPFQSPNGSSATLSGKENVQFYTQIKTIAQQWKDLSSRRISLPLPPMSEPEISSRRVSFMQHLTSDSDLLSLEISPAVPSAYGNNFPRSSMLSFPSRAEEEAPSRELEVGLSRPEGSVNMPSTSEKDSVNHEAVAIPPITDNESDKGTPLCMPPTTERIYVPQASEWGATLPLTSTSASSVLSASDGIYLTSASGRIDTTEPGVQRIQAPTSERSYLSTSCDDNNIASSIGSEYVSSVSLGHDMQRTNGNQQAISERVYMPLITPQSENVISTYRSTEGGVHLKPDMTYRPASQGNENMGLFSLRTGASMYSPSGGLYMSTPYRADMIPSQKANTDPSAPQNVFLDSSVQRNDGKQPTSERTFNPSTSQGTISQTPITSVAEYGSQGVSHTFPANQ